MLNPGTGTARSEMDQSAVGRKGAEVGVEQGTTARPADHRQFGKPVGTSLVAHQNSQPRRPLHSQVLLQLMRDPHVAATPADPPDQ